MLGGAWQVLGTLNRALCTAVVAQNGTRVEAGRGRPLPSNWPAIVRNTAMDAHLSVLKALVTTNANSPKGFRLMFQLAEALVNNNELCTPDGAKPRKCVPCLHSRFGSFGGPSGFEGHTSMDVRP